MADERAFTKGLGRFFGSARGVRIGIGDDAAVVRNPARDSVLCCDPVVEGVHFTRSTPLRQVGKKVVNRNLADLAAMGAMPDWLLVSMVLPPWCAHAERRELLHGIRSAARAAKATVVGGDVASTRGPLVVTVTAIGHPVGRVLVRDAARVGDTLHVSGPLGGSSLGHHLSFRPPLTIGRWLAAQPTVHAAMDVSDGFLLDLATMLDASGGLGAEIDATAVPVSTAARKLARGARRPALRHALGDGEDHVLLWTQQAGRALAAGGPLSSRARAPVGRVVATPGLWLVHDGRRERVPALGYRHELADRRRPAR